MTDAQVVYQQQVNRNFGKLAEVQAAKEIMHDETYPVSWAWHHPPPTHCPDRKS